MRFSLLCLRLAISATLLLNACSATNPDEDPLETTSELRAATDRGPLRFGASVSASISASEPRSAWSFTLTGQATIQLRTEATSAGEIDTVLLLQRENARGQLRTVARDDDEAPGSVLSSIERSLAPGNYRVVVQGKNQRVRGGFVLASACTGPDCAAACDPSPDVCLFGASFYELMHGESSLEIAGEEQITSAEQLDHPLWQQQLVLAVQQSSHTDVTTAEEALLRVDQQTVRRLWLLDRAGSRAFTAYEYGAGDNSYGAIFARGTTEIVASIHDGDFLECTVRGE